MKISAKILLNASKSSFSYSNGFLIVAEVKLRDGYYYICFKVSDYKNWKLQTYFDRFTIQHSDSVEKITGFLSRNDDVVLRKKKI